MQKKPTSKGSSKTIRRIIISVHYHQALKTTVLPICRYLQQNTYYYPVVWIEDDPNGTMQHMCREANIDCIRFQSSDGSLVKRIEAQRRILQQLAPRCFVLLDDRTYFTMDLIHAATLEDIPTLVLQWAATASEAVMVAIRALSASAIDETMAQRARQRVPQAVRDYYDQEVWWIPPERALEYANIGAFPTANPWIFGGGNATHVAVWGPFWKRLLIKHGVAPDKISVTGHPEHDAWLQVPFGLEQQLAIPANKRVITVLSPAISMRQDIRKGDVSVTEMRDYLRFVTSTLQRLGNDYQIAFKVHPRDQKLSFDFFDSSVKIIRECDLPRLLKASELVLCQWSTALMMAQVVGTPVISFDFHNTPSGNIWRGAPGVIEVRGRQLLWPTVSDILYGLTSQKPLNHGRNQFLQDYLCLDGHAQQRIINLINTLAEK